MPDQIYIGNFTGGMKTYREAFVIDNDAFPNLFNFYVWRGRAKRKRGTEFFGRLQKQVDMVSSITKPWQYIQQALSGGAGNLISQNSLESNASIVPGSLSIVVGANTYTEPATPNGTLVGTPAGSGTINYATGSFTIAGGAGSNYTGTFTYYPARPVMGLREYVPNLATSQYPLLLAFDTGYAYQVNQSGTPFFYDVSYYKGTGNPVMWSNFDYAQFWTCNYQSAFWATNNKPGLHFLNGTYTSGSGTNTITFNFKSNSANFTTLIVGDQLWFNEWTGSINGLVGTVSSIAGAASGNYVVTFTSTPSVSGTGIVQMLTNSIPNQDGIRWYDGDMTSGTGLPTSTTYGWVNFAPPLTATTVSINDQTTGLYYLVGCLAMVPYKDRIVFFGPQIQTSSGPVIQKPYQDTAIWSWNGTPYYNSLVPTNATATETYSANAYYVDQTGLGGWQSAGIAQPIVSVINNEDVLLVGFGGTGRKTRFVYTSDDLNPFVFYLINNELPSSSTFSGISMDHGGIDIGNLGITITTQQSCERIDLDIPDSIFQIQQQNNGLQRVNAVRDFYKEWIYFTYPYYASNVNYPTLTLLFNYRDNTWGMLYENYTAQGVVRKQSTNTWLTVSKAFGTWANWVGGWNAGASAALFPSICAGTPQGYVVLKSEDGTNETPTGDIAAITTYSGGDTQITSYNHCVSSANAFLNSGDYLYFSGALGITGLNGNIGKVIRVLDVNNFVVDIQNVTGTYEGLGTFTRLSQPLLQTKQFPVYWEQGRKVRLCAQKYLFNNTYLGQVTANIYLSQDNVTPYNFGPITPNEDTINPTLIYSNTVYTCPESTNIGLSPANTNLQMPTALSSKQIWHRLNTSLIGDTFQIGITLSDAQMRNLALATNEITLHGMQFTVSPGPLLS